MQNNQITVNHMGNFRQPSLWRPAKNNPITITVTKTGCTPVLLPIVTMETQGNHSKAPISHDRNWPLFGLGRSSLGSSIF